MRCSGFSQFQLCGGRWVSDGRLSRCGGGWEEGVGAAWIDQRRPLGHVFCFCGASFTDFPIPLSNPVA